MRHLPTLLHSHLFASKWAFSTDAQPDDNFNQGCRSLNLAVDCVGPLVVFVAEAASCN